MSEATQTLHRVLDDAETVLALFLDGYRQLLPERLVGPMLGAWPTVRDRFKAVRQILANPSEQLELELMTVGLTGAELAMKVTGYQQAREQLDYATREEVPVRLKPPPRGLGWLFQRVFAWLNLILGSLSKVIPGAEAIKEFKEGIENGIKDNAPPPRSR